MRMTLFLALVLLGSSAFPSDGKITLGSVEVVQRELQEHGCDDLDQRYSLSQRFANKTFSYPEPFALEVNGIMINHFKSAMANTYSPEDQKKLFPFHAQRLFNALFAACVYPKNT